MDEKPSKWAAQLNVAQLALRKTLQTQESHLDHIIRKYNAEEEGVFKELDQGRQVAVSSIHSHLNTQSNLMPK